MDGTALEKSVCMGMSCGLVFDGRADICPECGKPAVPQASIRVRGWISIVCGLVLLGIMGTVLWFIVPILLAPDQEVNGTSFDGTQEQMTFMLAIFAMVIAVGFAALFAGYVQVVHGRRQRGAIKVLITISAVLFMSGLLVRRGIIS